MRGHMAVAARGPRSPVAGNRACSEACSASYKRIARRAVPGATDSANIVPVAAGCQSRTHSGSRTAARWRAARSPSIPFGDP